MIPSKRKVLFVNDLSGQQVLHEVFSGNYSEVSINTLPRGVDIAYLLYNGQILKAEKIVKRVKVGCCLNYLKALI